MTRDRRDALIAAAPAVLLVAVLFVLPLLQILWLSVVEPRPGLQNYHLLVEEGEFSLSVDEAVAYSRPSVDVLFESAADAYREGVVGVILTGANADGARRWSFSCPCRSWPNEEGTVR